MQSKLYPRWQRIIGMLLLIGALTALTALHPGAARPATAAGELIVVVQATPSIQVRPGDILTYEIQVKNFNRAAHSNIRVYLPYDSSQLTILGAEFTHPDDWVSELSPVHVLVTFSFIAGGNSCIAKLQTRVNPELPHGTVITTWPSYSWANSISERRPRSSNSVPVLVGPTNETSPFVWLAVEPNSGPVGTEFAFFSDRFLPNEPVQASLLVPGYDPEPLGMNVSVNGQGQVWLSVASGARPLQPGQYTLQVEGQNSNLKGSTTFVVEP